MKSRILSAMVIASALMLSACATAPGSDKPTPAQIAAQVCPAVVDTVHSLASLNGLSEKAKAALDKASPLVDAACSGLQTVDASSLRSIARTVMPILLEVVDAAPLSESDHDRIVLGLTVGQIVIEGALQATQK